MPEIGKTHGTSIFAPESAATVFSDDSARPLRASEHKAATVLAAPAEDISYKGFCRSASAAGAPTLKEPLPSGESVGLDIHAEDRTVALDTDIDLLDPNVVRATYNGVAVDLRVKSVVYTSYTVFDINRDYNADTHTLHVHTTDGSHTRAQAEYYVTYEAYSGDQTYSPTKTITVAAFDDTVSGDLAEDDSMYISLAEESSVIDGTEPFDTADGRGYDKAADNGVVRTYDTVTHSLQLSYKIYGNAAYRSYKKATVGFEAVLPGNSSDHV